MSKLSYNKFSELLTKNAYILTVVYYGGKNNTKSVLFFEVKLPKTQKSVLVRIPPKYSMILPDGAKAHKIEIVEMDETKSWRFLTEKSMKYLLEIRGPLIDSDLIAISADGLCYSKFNGDTLCYYFLKKYAYSY